MCDRAVSGLQWQVGRASEYTGALSREGITLSVQQRKQGIWAAVGDVARYFGGYIQDTYRGDLLQVQIPCCPPGLPNLHANLQLVHVACLSCL